MKINLKMINSRFNLLLIIFIFLLTSCLEENASIQAPSIQSEFNSNSFAGIQSVVNKSGPIQINWVPSSVVPKGYNIYRGFSTVSMSLLEKVGPNDTSYLDSSVVLGQVYVYKVKAYDSKNIEDSNNVLSYGISHPGIYEALSTGTGSVTIGVPYVIGAIDSLYVFAQPVSSPVIKKFGPFPSNATSINVSGLRTGTSYKLSVQGYVADYDLYDGNTKSITVQTDSTSFSGLNLSDYKYRGFINVKAYGAAPGAPVDIAEPDRIPNARLVSLKALAFSGMDTLTTKYSFFRIENASGRVPDTNVITPCTNATTSSCIPVGCDDVGAVSLNGTFSVSCIDKNVAEPPAKYFYAISLKKSDADGAWIEELPKDSPESVVITVQIPPNNMVLTQRDAANYEMCMTMGKQSDPKKKQRCVYSGLGATTLDKGPGTKVLNLEPGYYDFGYNLFVDRWEAACNWTTVSRGGKCGPGGTDGNCIGDRTPLDNTIGDEGNVYAVLHYETNHPTAPTTNFHGYRARCLIKKNGSWVKLDLQRAGDDYPHPVPALTQKLYTSNPEMMTSDPGEQGGFRFPFLNVDQENASGFCNAKNDSYYGRKRIPRSREFKVFAADEWLAGETSKSPAEIRSITKPESIGHYSGNWSCNQGRDLWNHARGTYATQPLSNGNGDKDFPHTLIELLDPVRNITGLGTITTIDAEPPATNVNRWEGNRYYFIGSLGTSHCNSRFGVQDAIGNAYEVASDNYAFVNYSGSFHLTGAFSTYDPTNTDLMGFYFGNFGTGYTCAPIQNCISYTSGGQPYTGFIPPIGIMTRNSGFGSIPKLQFLNNYANNQNARIDFSLVSSTVMVAHNGGSSTFDGGRWSSLISTSPSDRATEGFRCVLPGDE